MGEHVIKMPDIGEGIAEVEVVAWHVKPGEQIREDQLLAEVMTDKATVEIPSPVDGKVISLGGKVGEVMAVGTELVRIEVDGEGNTKPAAPRTVSTTSAPPQPPAPAEAAAAGRGAPAREGPAADQAPSQQPAIPESAASARTPASPPTGPIGPAPGGSAAQRAAAPALARQPIRSPGGRPLASPAVRRRAWDLGVELQFVGGSGEGGVILHEDLDAWLASRQQAVPAGPRARAAGYEPRDEEEAIPVVGLRRRIAQKMQEAKRRIPHYSYVEEVDVTELEALRARLNARWGDSRGKLTVLPLLLRAVVLAVRDYPQVNARFDDEAGVVTRHAAVHAGIATQTGNGLMVPVLRHAEAHDLWSAATEIGRLANAARAAKAAREELSGSTITITSLGPLGGIVTTPVINHPEVAIVGVNRIVERPMVRDGMVVIRKMMNLSSSFDHRVVDGIDAAQFIQAIRALLECPAMLFVE
jgi:2-oxoisovalerate dehydrogenase E2 component (dihydrolipoyl transacylase)